MQKLGTCQERQADGVHYILIRKRVRNINLRIAADGAVSVSASPSVAAARVDEFVSAHAAWVRQKQQAAALRVEHHNAGPHPDRRQAMALFTEISDRIFPLFSEVLQGQKPVLKVRNMSSRWGVCCPAKRQITLALGLAAVPLPLAEYVVLHEYCHFVHPNHQPEFWALMERYMPDARARRRALSQYLCGPV